MKNFALLFNLALVLVCSCKKNEEPTSHQLEVPSIDTVTIPEQKQVKTITYQISNAKEWLLEHKDEPALQSIVFAVNRTDRSNFSRMDSIIAPVDLSEDLAYYLPFPLIVPYLKTIDKIIFFSYPAQIFAAYENGNLVYTGPTNMGRATHLTPTGLYFTNWKAEETISTINEKWILRWNFNIESREGIGWHQYSLPGYPVSHSCLRLLEADAKYLYDWADQWQLANKDSIMIQGTPVIVFGVYNFNTPKPWLKLISDSRALDITPEELQKTTQPFLFEIQAAQTRREIFEAEEQRLP